MIYATLWNTFDRVFCVEVMELRKQKGRVLRWIGITLSILFVLLSVLILGVGAYLKATFARELPDELFSTAGYRESPHFFVYSFSDRENRVGEAVELEGIALDQPSGGYVSYTEMPGHLIDAFVAIEDKRFFEHRGVDWRRSFSAVVNYLSGGKRRFGASTITQQLVKNLTGDDEITPKRKLREIFLARELERRLDKTQILEQYLNIIHFSDRCDGIGAAAEHYFSKSVGELTVEEAATLAAITNNPSYYHPIRNPENNRRRRELILSEMHAQGYLSEKSYQEALSRQVVLSVKEQDDAPYVNSWYLDMVIEDVINALVTEHGLTRAHASQLVYHGGVRIDIAMDPQVQSTVEDYYDNVIHTPKNEKGESAQSALIVLDSRTGDVLGVAGAVGEKQGNRLQNFATQTKRPPGSVIKPLSVYAPALEEGQINWASVFDDVPIRFDQNGRTFWPKNANGIYRGLTNVRYAVAHSTNTVSVRVLEKLGTSTSFDYAKNRFHLESMVDNDRDVAALALGQLNYGVTLREVTAAYTAFADGGIYHPYRSFYRVLAPDGTLILSNLASGERVISEGNAAIMTKLLEGVVREGTSSSVDLWRRVACAGKTGTSNDDGDRWFVGYTTGMVCGVWCGYEYPEPLSGRNLCTSVWNDVMGMLTDFYESEKDFPIPSTVVRTSYCKDSGKLLDEVCLLDARGDRSEVGWFLKGDEPKSHCTCHVRCRYDTVHGGVAHKGCDEENLEDVALIRVERHFPRQVTVTDAQYVYGGDPRQMAPNPDPTQAYFEKNGEFCGKSAQKEPFNRSCTGHGTEGEGDWSYLSPGLLPQPDE